MKLKTNDIVIVTAGKDKGTKGKILKVFPKLDKVLVEGVNIYAKHIKPKSDQQKGETVRRERALPMGNVSIFNEETGKADRVGYKIEEKSGEKVRIFKKTGKAVTK